MKQRYINAEYAGYCRKFYCRSVAQTIKKTTVCRHENDYVNYGYATVAALGFPTFAARTLIDVYY